MTTQDDDGTSMRDRIIELVRLDYEATCSLIDGVLRTSWALRGIGLTLIIALLSFAVDQGSLPVALGASAAVCLFLYADAYHGWLYSHALRRANEMERILGLRYKQLERGGADPDVGLDLDVALATHRFGQYSNIPRFRLRLLRRARPKVVYLGLYGSLAVLSAAAAVYTAVC